MVMTAEYLDEESLPRRRWVTWNEYDGRVSTLRLGFGFLFDYGTYSQDATSKQQVTMSPEVGLRDFRFVVGGRFKTERPASWTLGYMYDDAEKSWLFRLTGIDIGVPELKGRVFIGRTKEGYSMVKLMNGYNPWGMERSPVQDAFMPILADGVRWRSYFEQPRLFFSLAYFNDLISDNEKFATYDNQVVARVAWQPVLSEAEGKLFHIGVMGRGGEPDEDKMQFRARPEASMAPFFVDTGKFPVDRAGTTGFEAYYRAGPWLFGTEYNWQAVDATTGHDPVLHGGDVVATWLITGETRPYNAAAAIFEAISPTRTVFEGGPGAFEAVLRLSYTDFDSGSFHGGRFWRLTPMVNWHLSYNVRLEAVYGFGILDRFDLEGETQFFQSRLQLRL